MSGRYLTDLADVIRRRGLAVVEYEGWQTRARSSGGYDTGRPNHVMCHHTASGPSSDGESDCHYMCHGSDAAPVSNLYLDRAGVVWVLAAGATNTNGKGRDPCGLVAVDSMNTAAIAVECANTGVGEVYPDPQQRAYAILVRALCDAYAIPVGRVHAHFEWAPDRKIDPAGPARWAPHPTGGGGGNEWNMNAFRGDVAAGWPTSTPPPDPQPEPASHGFPAAWR